MKPFNDTLNSGSNRGWNSTGSSSAAGSWNRRMRANQLSGLWYQVPMASSRVLKLFGSGLVSMYWGTGALYYCSFDVASGLYSMVYPNTGRYDFLMAGDVGLLTTFDSLSDSAMKGNILSFASCTGLQELRISHGGFYGTINALSSLAALKIFDADGTRVSGNLASFPAGIERLSIPNTDVLGNVGSLGAYHHLTYADITATAGTYTTADLSFWADGVTLVFRDLGLSGAEIDQLMVDLVASGCLNGSLDISGTNQPPGNVTALSVLRGRGWTVVCANPSHVAVGDLAYGGMVAYLLQPGDPGYDAAHQHGLVISGPAYVNEYEYPWSNETAYLGTTSYAIGSGAANSAAIVGQAGHTTSAAKYCLDLVSGGCSDWYLPSVNEFFAILRNEVILTIEKRTYWTSSESRYENPGNLGMFITWYEDEVEQLWYEDADTKLETSYWFYAVRSF